MIKMTETITKLEVLPKEDTKRRTLEAIFIREGEILFKISGDYNREDDSVEVTEATGIWSTSTGNIVPFDFIHNVLKSTADHCRIFTRYKCDYEYSLKLK